MSEYKRIPSCFYDIRINKHGDVRSFEPGVPDPNITLDKRGYHVFYIKRTGGVRTSPSVHRLVGILFIDIPERLKHYNIDELQVNHKDGDKGNNDISNLEWVTPRENIFHANENELFSTRVPVLAKCIEDGTITRYRSTKLAADVHNLPSSDIREHIMRSYAGAVVVDGYAFKADDGSEWSTKKIHPNARQGLRLTYRVTGFDKLTNEEWLFTSIPDACQALGLSLNVVKYRNTRMGSYTSPDGRWLFTLETLPSIVTPRTPIISLNRETGETKVYKSFQLTTRETKIAGFLLKNHVEGPLAGMIPWNGLYYKKNDGLPFPKAEYLFPDLNHMGKTIKHVVFKQCDDTPYLIATIADICKQYKWDDSCYYDHRLKHGMGALFRGVRIYNIDDVDLGNRGNDE